LGEGLREGVALPLSEPTGVKKRVGKMGSVGDAVLIFAARSRYERWILFHEEY
jgi:hypothetical protein